MFDALKTCFHLFFPNSIFRGFRLYATFERSIGPAAARQINFFCETHILGDIEQKLKIVPKFCCSLATRQRAQVFRSCKFGLLLLAEIQTTY
jgi:hypothetical protein